MALFNLGSITYEVFNLIENIPTSIRGTTLTAIADRQRAFVEEYTGLNVGSVDIVLRFQESIIQLTASKVVDSMITLGADVSSIKLGDLSISKGSSSNLDVAGKKFKEVGMDSLKQIGRKLRFHKSLG